jgi:hypothetical protein
MTPVLQDSPVRARQYAAERLVVLGDSIAQESAKEAEMQAALPVAAQTLREKQRGKRSRNKLEGASCTSQRLKSGATLSPDQVRGK